MAKRRKPAAPAKPAPDPAPGPAAPGSQGLTAGREWAVVLAASGVAAAVFHFAFPNIADLDSFYYIRLASLLRTRGWLAVDFPWLDHSAIERFSASLWYGFAVFLVPFTGFSDLVTGIKTAGALLTVLAVASYYWAVKRCGMRLAVLWPFLFLFSAPNVLYQLIMTRPQLVSLALSPLLLSFLISPARPLQPPASEGARAGLVPLFAISLAFAWLHLNFVWLALLILGVAATAGWIVERRLDWGRSAAVVAGALLGWLARPNPLGAAQLLYVQSAQKLLAPQDGAALLSGAENLPLSSAVLLRSFVPFAALWIAALLGTLAGYARVKALPAAQRVLLGSSLALSIVFFLLTVLVGRRSYNLWTAFGVMFVAGVFSHVLPLVSAGSRKAVRLAATCAVAGVLGLVVVDSSRRTAATLSRSGYPPDMLRDAGLWLARNARAGELVFNLRWSHFSPLFFWNQANHYAAGLDPIFLYAHDRALYWKFHHLAADAELRGTCAEAVCSDQALEDVHEVLRRDFRASYVVLLKSDRAAYSFFERDARFHRELETAREVVYRLE